MGLAFDYSEGLASDLDVIAVYLPGDDVKPDDIITFDYRSWPWGTVKPYGAFIHVSSLMDLGVNLKAVSAADPQPYQYATSNKVGFSFTADASASAAAQGSGTLDVSFNSEGSIFLNALGCKKSYLSDISNLSNLLSPYKAKIDWKQCFIVTGVTIAQKAVVMQSGSSTAGLTLKGDVKQLQPGSGTSVNLNASVSLVSEKNAAFIKDWSDNVNVFMNLVKYEPSSSTQLSLNNDALRAQKLYVKESDEFIIRSVNPRDYVDRK